MRATPDCTPASHPDRPGKRNPERSPALSVEGAVGRALIATLAVAVLVTIAVPPAVGGTMFEAADRAGFKWHQQEEAGERASSDHLSWRRLAGLPTLVPATPAPVDIPKVEPPIGAAVGISVPPLAGQPAAAAGAALRRVGLKWQQQAEPSETTSPGRVISTSPSPGALVDKGSTVTLVVALPVRIPVPQIVGQTGKEATTALSRVGFKSQRREQSTTKVPPGRVISTSPAGGQSVEKGATVTLLIAKPVTASYRDSSVRASPSPPSGIAATTPWAQQPTSPPRETAPVAPWTPQPSGPPSGGATFAEPAPATLSGDALIGHLYDNAHRSY